MASITTIVQAIRDEIYGKDVRENIAQGIEAINTEVESTTLRQNTVESTFQEVINLGGNPSAEVVQARIDTVNNITYENLQARMDADASSLADKQTQIDNLNTNKAEKTEVNALDIKKADITYVNSEIQNMSSQVQGFYATVTDLTTAFPTGNANNYVVTADNYIYRWSGSAWASTGYLFNATGIADVSVTPKKTSFIHISANLFNKNGVLNPTVVNTDGTESASSSWYTTDFIDISGHSGQFICTNTAAGYSMLSFYRADGSFYGRIAPADYLHQWTISAAVVKVKISISKGYTENAMVAISPTSFTAAPAYEAFGMTLQDIKVPQSSISGKSDISAILPQKIYTYQDSTLLNTPPTAVFLDSIVQSGIDVAFSNGLDRKYVMASNATVLASNTETETITDTIKGDNYNDLAVSFSLVKTKVSVGSTKDVVFLQIGDSVTNGTSAQYNSDKMPNTSWGVMAELAKKYLNSITMVGKSSADAINVDTAYQTVKAEGHGGWKLTDYLYSASVDVANPFYNASKTWTNTALNTAGVKFSLNKYLTDNAFATPTHIVIQLGFNDISTSDLAANISLMIQAIKEEYPTMTIGISLPRDYGTWYPKYYKDYVMNNSSIHSGLLTKLQGWIANVMALENISNKVYFIPTYFVTPTAEAIPTSQIGSKQVAITNDNGYHPNHTAHAEWGKQMFAWLLYTLV